MRDVVDLRHDLQTRAAPRGPEVEDHNPAFVFGQAEFLTVEQVEFNLGRGLTEERRVLTFQPFA